MIPPPDDRPTLPPAAESHIPGPARVPTGLLPTERVDPIAALAERVGDLSDALHDPDGLVHRLFADLAQKGAKRELRAQRRHRQTMRALSQITHTLETIANGVADLSARVAKLEPPEVHEARLRLVEAKPAE